MVSWRECPVDDPEAHRLLTDYFASRAAGFPGGPGAYRTVFPAPAQFVPPAGVFLLAEVGGSSSGPGPRIETSDAGFDTAAARPAQPAQPTAARPAQPAVGCGGIRLIEPGADGLIRFEVKHLWVEPAARGTGLGRAMLAELERRARGFGAEELVLDTNASLQAAAGLYRSSGFSGIEPYNDNPNATNWYGKRL